jgi:peptide/nickel transport system ATP-binding protein
MHLIDPDECDLVFDGKRVGTREMPMKEYRRQVQMVFQDSYSSLNPRLTIEDSIAFSPQVHGVSRREALTRTDDLLERV